MDESAAQPESTYRIDHNVAPARYYCCVCDRADTEHWSPDEDAMRQHQAQRHAGMMVEGAGPDRSGAPPAARTLSAEPDHAPAEPF